MIKQYFDDLRLVKEFKISKYVSIALKIVIDPSGKRMIDIRTYKTFNGVTMPTKKGVWMSLDDFNNTFLPTLIAISKNDVDLSTKLENNQHILDYSDIAI